MDQDMQSQSGGCHCGAVRFEVRFPGGEIHPARCNCSICRMRGAVVSFVALEDFALTQGADALSEYRFNTREARHYFCSVCGIYTHHQRRANPNQYCVNLACLDGVSPFDFAEMPVVDGIHHPNDSAAGPGSPMQHAGTLRYVPLNSDRAS